MKIYGKVDAYIHIILCLGTSLGGQLLAPAALPQSPSRRLRNFAMETLFSAHGTLDFSGMTFGKYRSNKIKLSLIRDLPQPVST
jgi:hypothetical protein